jgi:sialic acid synthase SpsE
MKKIAVIGSRTFTDYDLLKRVLSEYSPFILVSGGCKGADRLSEIYIDEKGYQKIIIKPDWKKYKKGAALRRNAEIVKIADELIAFKVGDSRGTCHCIELAKKKGIPVRVIEIGDRNDK